jgi:RNA polymerase sigma factor (sigma-70 family)
MDQDHDNGRQDMDLEGFYAGDRAVLTAVYRRHVARVERAVSRYCRGADAECVIHDLFLQIIERPEVRRQFTGGDLGAWLATIAARRAVDFLRRRRRWTLLDDPRSLEGDLEPVDDEQRLLHRDQVRHLEQALERFARQELPGLGERLAQIFELRFRQRVSQKEGARVLGIPRTTFIDREQRLMKQLGRFLREAFEIKAERRSG